MGALLDSTFLISSEREGLSAAETLLKVDQLYPTEDLGVSVISVMEVAHGEARADTGNRAQEREVFLTELMHALDVYPITSEIARRAGRLDGKLKQQGVQVAFPDLLIGVTALDLGFSVITRNLRHFARIPGLKILSH